MSATTSRMGGGVSVAVCSTRCGVKGRAAAQLLLHSGVPVPSSANEIVRWRNHAQFGNGRCLRLGLTEFVLEQDNGHTLRDTVRGAPGSADGGAWFAHRADHSLLLNGPAWPGELARVCSFDFDQLRSKPDQVVMTLLADVSVTLAREPTPDPAVLSLRLWCDPGYAMYMNHCLYLLNPDLAELTGDSR